MLSRPRTLPAGFIQPCLPTKAPSPPSGALCVYEIKHDGFRVIARKSGERVKLYSRPGNDLTDRFPLIVEALGRLRSRSCIIDGEAVACDDHATPSFDCIRYRPPRRCPTMGRTAGGAIRAMAAAQGRVGQVASSVFNIERPCG